MAKCPYCGQKTKGSFCRWCGYPLKRLRWVRVKNGENYLRELISIQKAKGELNIQRIVQKIRKKVDKETREEAARIITQQLTQVIKEQAKKEALERARRETEQIISQTNWKTCRDAEVEQIRPPVEQLAQDLAEEVKAKAPEKDKEDAEQILREAGERVPEENKEELPIAMVEPEEAMELVDQQSLPSEVDSFEPYNQQPDRPVTSPIANKTRVFIVDRDLLFDQGLRLYLSRTDDIEVVGTSEDLVSDTLLMIEELESDVVLVDIDLPSLSGFYLVQQITEHLPDATVIVMTPCADDEQILKALKAGAAGYLEKDTHAEELTDAIRSVSEGDHIIRNLLTRPKIARQVLIQFEGANETEENSGDSPSPQEMDMLEYFANGYSLKQVAYTMVMSDEAIEDTLASIVSRLIRNERYVINFSGNAH